jgi:predicted phage tail protein
MRIFVIDAPINEGCLQKQLVREATMAISKNVAGVERTGRIVLGIILILLGFFLSGLWKPLFIAGGAALIFTATVGY